MLQYKNGGINFSPQKELLVTSPPGSKKANPVNLQATKRKLGEKTESWKLNYLFHREIKPNIANDEPKEVVYR